MIRKLSIDPGFVPHFALHNGILKYKGRIWICSNTKLQYKLLVAYHSSEVGGHLGTTVTYQHVKATICLERDKAICGKLCQELHSLLASQDGPIQATWPSPATPCTV